MSKLPLAIVGCGGMGGRHLLGLKELYDSEMCNVELVAACDLRRDNAEHLADEAQMLMVIFQVIEAIARNMIPPQLDSMLIISEFDF